MAAFLYLRNNLFTNMQRLDQPLDFGYLDNSAGFRIPATDFRSSDTVLDSLYVGVKNTISVSAAGIVLALLLGTLIGIARLSTNWLVARAATLYVETIRNIPLLVIIFFWSAAVILKLPRITDPAEGPGVVLSNRGLWVPWLRGGDGARAFTLLMVVAVVAAAIVAVWRTRVNERTGRPHHRVAWALGLLLVVGVVGFIALGGPLTATIPSRIGRAVTGGIAVQPGFAALLAGLVVYTASHIAEIVRGSIQAVPRGQTEAAFAVGLTSPQRLRLVVLPQAMRIALPQLANQFLNLTKNSSLGIAVAYPELMSLTVVNVANNAPAPQSFAVAMVFYLALSLVIAGSTNVLNRRLQRTVA